MTEAASGRESRGGATDRPAARQGLGHAFAADSLSVEHESLADSGSATIATSVRIDSACARRLKAYRDSVGWTTGEVIIDALETTYDGISDLLYPEGPIGGTLFARRGASGQPVSTAPKSALYLRLLAEDYTVLDGLVETTGARSRTHLIETALTAYLDQKELGNGPEH